MYKQPFYKKLMDKEKLEELIDSDLYDIPSLTLLEHQLCDLELILCDAFFPLKGFMGQADYQSVLSSMRLKNGTLWPIPVTLDVDDEVAEKIAKKEYVLLLDMSNTPVAKLKVNEMWKPDKTTEALSIYGTDRTTHPGVAFLFNQRKNTYISGVLTKLTLPTHYDFNHLRHSPDQLKQLFKEKNWDKVVAFQTRNPMHKAHVALTMEAAEKYNANILLHPVAGPTKSDDIDYIARVKCYEKILHYYPQNKILLSLLPLCMRMAGPREALWHAIIRKNYHVTHFIIGRDHAGCVDSETKKDFYSKYAAHDLVKKYENELGITLMYAHEMVHLKENNSYVQINKLDNNKHLKFETISGKQLRESLRSGTEIPAWFTYPEVLHELKLINMPKIKQGFTVFFTGLSGAGKSTIANALLLRLHELTTRTISLLDGDIVRHKLSKELGFSKEDRETNILRIAYVASEITKHRGVAICAPIAPYRHTRRLVKKEIIQYGSFFEVYIATPIEVCEQRDPKGLYAKARMGKLNNFTGIDDVYEPPEEADVVIDTAQMSINEAVKKIVDVLKLNRLIR